MRAASGLLVSEQSYHHHHNLHVLLYMQLETYSCPPLYGEEVVSEEKLGRWKPGRVQWEE